MSINESLDLEKLSDSTHLLDLLLDFEQVLDSLDIYVYKHWLNGEVYRGPIVRRHWVTVDVRYPYHQMPDPRAALRLVKHGIQVEFNRVKQEQPGNITEPDHEPATYTDWIITITMPRLLIDTTKETDLELYDDDVDTDDVTAAKDIGLDDESPYQQSDQPPAQAAPMAQPAGAPVQGMPPNAQ